jgi:hypothetical protein
MDEPDRDVFVSFVRHADPSIQWDVLVIPFAKSE